MFESEDTLVGREHSEKNESLKCLFFIYRFQLEIVYKPY